MRLLTLDSVATNRLSDLFNLTKQLYQEYAGDTHLYNIIVAGNICDGTMSPQPYVRGCNRSLLTDAGQEQQ